MSVNSELRDKILAHGHSISRYEAGAVRDLLRTLELAQEDLTEKILATQGEYTEAWLKDVLEEVSALYKKTLKESRGTLEDDLKGLAEVEASFAQKTLKNSLPIKVSVAAPASAQVWAAIERLPADRGSTMGDLWDSLSKSASARIQKALRRGIVEGETIDQMIRRVRGVTLRPRTWVSTDTGKRIVGKSKKELAELVAQGEARIVQGAYSGGVMQTTTREAEGIVRTAVMHVSNEARNQIYKENSDLIKGVQIVATLDVATCPICGAEDGKVYDLNEGPRSPFHVRCRCTTVPVTKSWRELGLDLDEISGGTRASMNGYAADKKNYGPWLREQPRSVVVKVLGEAKADLFLQGKLDITNFVADGKVITLKELKAEVGDLPEKKLVFEAAQNIAEAEAFAVKADLADKVSYKGASIEAANSWNQSIFEHLEEFPELRKTLKFLGTTQERQRRYVSLRSEELFNNPNIVNWYPDEAKRREFAVLQARKEAGKTPGNVMAFSYSDRLTSGISVNSKYAGDPEYFKKVLLRGVESGFHPEGTASIKAIADHEMGHEMDKLLNFYNNAKFRALIKDKNIKTELSEYAGKNLRETIAEAWSEYRNNPNPRPLAKALGDLILKEYNSLFGKEK